MIFLIDADFARGPDKKPRKRRNFKGVVGNSLIGAATGGAIGDYATGAIRPGSTRLKRIALVAGLTGGALATGISKYRSNNRQTR